MAAGFVEHGRQKASSCRNITPRQVQHRESEGAFVRRFLPLDHLAQAVNDSIVDDRRLAIQIPVE